MRMAKLVIAAGLFLALALPLVAKPKQQVYSTTPKQLFAAALRAAREHYVVRDVDNDNLGFTFETGESLASNGMSANAFVEPDGKDKSKLVVNVQKGRAGGLGGGGQLFAWGAGDRTAKKFFGFVEDELKEMDTEKH